MKEYKMKNYQKWGNTISWTNFESKKINGYKLGLKVDDIIISEMTSGKEAKFKIVEIEYDKKIKDMFSGTVEFVEYI
jgi:hypothetical protein